jgi:transposase
MLDWMQDVREGFERKYEKPACEALLELIEHARQSAQKPLARLAGTLERWLEPIVRYVRHRYTNVPTEDFNNKNKLTTFSYGFAELHYDAGALGGIGPTWYGRIISSSSCSTMWQCQT